MDAAEKMGKYNYNSSKRIKTTTFTLGDTVIVKVPFNDRATFDMHRVPGVVEDIKKGYHKIFTQFGVLKTWYQTDELEKCVEWLGISSRET